MSIDVPSPGDPILDTWGEAVADAINYSLVDGPLPLAFPIGADPSKASGGTYNLPASGGAVLVPFVLSAPMLYTRAMFYNTSATATLRTAEGRLYRHDASAAAMTEVAGTAVTWSFTPGAASTEVSSAVTAVLLPPGTYWLAIRNTSASYTLDMGWQGYLTLARGCARHANTTASALGASLALAEYPTQETGPYLVALEGLFYGANYL